MAKNILKPQHMYIFKKLNLMEIKVPRLSFWLENKLNWTWIH